MDFRFQNVRSRRPAAISSTTENAVCATTSKLESLNRSIDPVESLPSFSVVHGSTRLPCRAGAIPNATGLDSAPSEIVFLRVPMQIPSQSFKEGTHFPLCCLDTQPWAQSAQQTEPTRVPGVQEGAPRDYRLCGQRKPKIRRVAIVFS